MKKIQVDWATVEKLTAELLRQIHISGWHPDYVIGITRGGLVPANLISQYLGCPMHTLQVSLRPDFGEPLTESNCWMAEDAYGHVPLVDQNKRSKNNPRRKNILIVDDINDSGATINWIRQDWQSACFPNEQRTWDDIWSSNVRIAVLYNNESSESVIDPAYSAVTINKYETPEWRVFPWEEWWNAR